MQTFLNTVDTRGLLSLFCIFTMDTELCLFFYIYLCVCCVWSYEWIWSWKSVSHLLELEAMAVAAVSCVWLSAVGIVILI